ncbi:MAG: hypothetical protein AB1743_02765 [Actinomycetota bacterium]
MARTAKLAIVSLMALSLVASLFGCAGSSSSKSGTGDNPPTTKASPGYGSEGQKGSTPGYGAPGQKGGAPSYGK